MSQKWKLNYKVFSFIVSIIGLEVNVVYLLSLKRLRFWLNRASFMAMAHIYHGTCVGVYYMNIFFLKIKLDDYNFPSVGG